MAHIRLFNPESDSINAEELQQLPELLHRLADEIAQAHSLRPQGPKHKRLYAKALDMWADAGHPVQVPEALLHRAMEVLTSLATEPWDPDPVISHERVERGRGVRRVVNREE